MKKQTIVALFILLMTSFTFTLNAQVNAQERVKTKSNIKNDRVSVVQINGTQEGCNIVVGTEVKSPRDPASGFPTGRRVYEPLVIIKEFKVNAASNETLVVTTPKDAQSGMASGKRTAGTPIGGIIVKGGKNPGGGQLNNIIIEDNQFTLPTNLPDGEYTMTLSWTWGESHPGSGKRCEKSFSLTMEDGVCKGITQSGALR